MAELESVISGKLDPQLSTNCAKESGRIEEDALHSAKGHFAAAGRWDSVHFAIGIPGTIAAAGAGLTALKEFPVAAASLATVGAVLAAIGTFLNPSGRANAHLVAGNQYLALRNAARIFREIEMLVPATAADIVARLRQLTEKRDELNAASPRIARWAYQQGKKALERGEARHEVDRRAP